MTALQWTPQQLSQLTIAQLLCLGNENPPGTAGTTKDFAELQRRLQAKRAEAEAWHSR